MLGTWICLTELDGPLGYVLLRREVWGEILSIVTLVVVEKHQVSLGKPFR